MAVINNDKNHIFILWWVGEIIFIFKCFNEGYRLIQKKRPLVEAQKWRLSK